MEETKRRRFIIRAVLEGEVDVQEEPQPVIPALFNWNFTDGLVDSVQGITATLGEGATISSAGLSLNGTNSQTMLADIGGLDQYTIEVDITSITFPFSGKNTIFGVNAPSADYRRWLVWSITDGMWELRGYGGSFYKFTELMDREVFFGKTLKLQVDTVNHQSSIFADGQLLQTISIDSAGVQASQTVYLGSAWTTALITGCRIYEGLV